MVSINADRSQVSTGAGASTCSTSRSPSCSVVGGRVIGEWRHNLGHKCQAAQQLRHSRTECILVHHLWEASREAIH